MLSFPAGTLHGAIAPVVVQVFDDFVTENAETVLLQVESVTGAGGLALVGSPARHTVRIYDGDNVIPPFDTGEPAQRPWLAIRFPESTSRSTSDTTVEQRAENLETAPATAGRVDVAEDRIALYLVVPDGDGRLSEVPLDQWDVNDVRDLSEIVRRLPDDRYRLYYERRDQTRTLILDVVVRDGRPIDPAETPSRTNQDAVGPPDAEATEEGPQLNPPESVPPPTAVPESNEEGAGARLGQPVEPDATGDLPLRGRAASLSAAGLAVALSSGSGPQRVRRELATYRRGACRRAARRLGTTGT
jgi:hypothetical protein